jgi:hypothetical protein
MSLALLYQKLCRVVDRAASRSLVSLILLHQNSAELLAILHQLSRVVVSAPSKFCRAVDTAASKFFYPVAVDTGKSPYGDGKILESQLDQTKPSH